MSKKHKMICTTLNYIEHFFILSFTITRCISISAFASLIGILIGCCGILGFLQSDSKLVQKLQNLKSIIQQLKRKNKKHCETILLAKLK